MTPEQHSALVEEARRLQAIKPQLAAALAQQFQLWDLQRLQMAKAIRQFVIKEPFVL